MSSRAAHGFTLLEVLVAVFIMALVISFAFQAYQGIAEAYERVSEISSRDRSARIVLDRIERELVGAVMIERENGADPLLHPYLFFAQPLLHDESEEGFELRFVTQTPLRSPGSPPASLALVTYGTVTAKSGHGIELLRQEEPLTAKLAKQVEWSAEQIVADNVALFKLSFSGDGVPVGEGWDSTGAAQLDQLPTAVEVSVTLWETDAEGDPWPGPEFTRVVNLPVRPFRLAPEDADTAAGGEADCGDGVTVTACLDGYKNEIEAASPSLAAVIRDTRSQVKDACWSAPQPSAALARLKVLMGGLPGFDPGECR
jgi:prepilin-type N-terminal cleavage/methylation domain-containing protein